MHTIFSSKVRLPLVFSVIALGFLVACGPSQAELDATATQLAGDIFATQTAQAPTATVTPTAREMAEEYYLKGEDFRLEEQWELAIEEFTQAISIDPEYAEAFLNRGLAYYSDHDEESAIADFEQAIDLGLDPQTPEIFTNRGRAFSIMEDYDSAIADFDEAIKIDPEFVEAYVRRGFVYAYDRDDFETGLADFEQAIALDPEYSLAYSRRADVYVRQGEYELAIEDLNRAIELDKQDPYTYADLGEALYYMGELEQAITNLDQAIELDPENYWAYYYRGIVNAGQGNYEQAIADFERAIELEPQDGWAYYERGYVYYFMGDLDKALDDLNQAIELEPQLNWAYYYRGGVYYDLGDYEGAIADLDEAIELNPQAADFFYSRGLIHGEISEPEAAINDLETALELGLAPEAEQHAHEVLDVLNAVKSSGLALDWLVTADDLEPFSDEIGIVQWKSVDEFEMVNRVCRAFNGLSWSANPNIATNCIFTVTPGTTFTDVIEWLNEMEMLSPEATILEPTVDYPGEYALYVGSTDYGHADFYAILFTNDLVYWSSVSLGVPLGYSREGVYIDSGEIIDTFLHNIFETNFERSASASNTLRPWAKNLLQRNNYQSLI